jgi:hypothetical protein
MRQVENIGPLAALQSECADRADRRELPLDVVEAVASALADAIVAELVVGGQDIDQRKRRPINNGPSKTQ